MMFEAISPLGLIIFGAILCAIFLFSYFHLKKKLAIFLIPFKKGKSYWCKVIAVSDGDTITCKRINLRRSETRIRFAFIDAPESAQVFGKEAHSTVRSMLDQKWVKIHIVDTDRYGRHVADIFCRGKNINNELVSTGNAWVYESYVKDKQRLNHLIELQNTAKKKKRGLWKNSRAIHPSEYRKQNK